MINFDDIVKNYKNRVFDTIYSIAGNSPEADDIAQEVFLKVYKNLHKFRADSSLPTWIYRITVNTCLDKLRKKNRENIFLETELNEMEKKHVKEAVIEDFPDPHLTESVQKALNSLPDKYRIIITLKEIDGLSYKEISEVMKISIHKVKVWLFRARKQFKTKLSFLSEEVK
ncbi:MAG: RNA polymerase sigma factor [Elusimicrobiota bacterium]